MELTRQISSERADLKEEAFAVMLALFRAIGVAESLLATGDGLDMKKDPREFTLPTAHGEGTWRYNEAGYVRNIDVFETCLKAVLTDAATRRKDGQDDARADQIDEMLVDLICLAAPEVGIPWRPEDKTIDQDACKSGKKLIEHIVKSDAFQEDDHTEWPSYFKRVLAPRIRRRRLDRMGSHIGTMLGLTLLRPDLRSPLNDRPRLVSLAKELREHPGAKLLLCPTRGEMLAAIGRHERERRLKHLDPSELEAVKEILRPRTSAPSPLEYNLGNEVTR